MQLSASIENIALDFTYALVAGDYAKAHGLLTPSLQQAESTADLKASYQAMISYTKAPVDTIEIGQTMPAREVDGIPESLGWVTVNVYCLHSPHDTWLEGITVLVVSHGSRQAIGRIVWGRP